MGNRIVACIMGQNCEKFLSMCIEGVKDADAIVFCDGGSHDGTLYQLDLHPEIKVIKNIYNQQDKRMNGLQRNFYLDYLKKNYSGWWTLCLDADEVLSDGGISTLKKFISEFGDREVSGEKLRVFDVKMRHLIQDLKHEDSVVNEHYCPRRLFKVEPDLSYPEVEHPVLQGAFKAVGRCAAVTLWHLAYIPNIWDIKKRYENHMQKSNMHSPEFLREWYLSHILGEYPKKEFNTYELPEPILKEFGLNKDELYFRHRGAELKHIYDAFSIKMLLQPKTAIELGCGLGGRVAALNVMGIECDGIEISEYAVKHALTSSVKLGDITDIKTYPLCKRYDLVILYDVLEHLEKSQVDIAINNSLSIASKYILVSVPWVGNPHLLDDATHKIFESQEWWTKQFTDKGCIQLQLPGNFPFAEQLMLFEVKR